MKKMTFVGKTYADSRVRIDIKDNVKKYNQLLIISVKDLKENGTENKNLNNDISDFIDKYNSTKTTNKEKELLSELMSETLDYLQIVDSKKEGNANEFNSALSSFQSSSQKISNYYKQ